MILICFTVNSTKNSHKEEHLPHLPVIHIQRISDVHAVRTNNASAASALLIAADINCIKRRLCYCRYYSPPSIPVPSTATRSPEMLCHRFKPLSLPLSPGSREKMHCTIRVEQRSYHNAVHAFLSNSNQRFLYCATWDKSCCCLKWLHISTLGSNCYNRFYGTEWAWRFFFLMMLQFLYIMFGVYNIHFLLNVMEWEHFQDHWTADKWKTIWKCKYALFYSACSHDGVPKTKSK